MTPKQSTYSRYYVARKVNHLCVYCGKPVTRGLVHCEDCRVKVNLRSNLSKRALHKNHLCVSCRKPCEQNNRVLCNKCLIKSSTRSKNLRKKRHAAGLCAGCGKRLLLIRNRVCEPCWFKEVALRWTGSQKNGPILMTIFKRQCGRCIYTGENLVLGETASLDHVVPRSRGGSSEPENLQWVGKRINEMKGNLIHEEFLKIISDIFHYGVFR